MKQRILALALVLLSLLILLHHLYVTGRFFDPGDILHHEFFEGVFLTAGLVLLASSYFRGK